MIEKCKAIAHGSTTLDYIFKEGKLGYRPALHNLCSREPEVIYEEMKVVNDYNNRCRNRFLRIEIGIAPQDEKKLSVSELMGIAHLFARQMGLDNHQWMAVTHKDIGSRHIHIIANHVSPYGEVYDTTFMSNRAAKVVEGVNRGRGLTVAKEVKAERKHQKIRTNPIREQAKQQVQKICCALLEKCKDIGVTGHSMFLYELDKNSITVERMKNKQGKVYDLKFSFDGQSFKASETGREFGCYSLQRSLETSQKAETSVSAQIIRKLSEHTDTKDADYQLMPPRLSYSPQATEDTPQITQAVRTMADTAISAADELVEGVSGVITPMTHGKDYAETAWQRRLRYQANRRKKRRRL